MKFGKNLLASAYEPWLQYYINYKELKDTIKEGCTSDEFVKRIAKELHKADNFLVGLWNQLVEPLHKLEEDGVLVESAFAHMCSELGICECLVECKVCKLTWSCLCIALLIRVPRHIVQRIGWRRPQIPLIQCALHVTSQAKNQLKTLH